MKLIETRTEASASPEEVWVVLMDFASYPSWNPMVVAINGEAELGQQLDITIAMKNGRRMKFNPTVVEFEDGRRFGWLGKLWLRGLFDGLHRFEIEPGATGTTFVHSEEFRGLLPPVLVNLLKETHESVEAMNEALVREVARRGTGAGPAAAPHKSS